MIKVGDQVRLVGREWRDVGAVRIVKDVEKDEYGDYRYLFEEPGECFITGPWYTHTPGYEVEVIPEKPKFKVGDRVRLTGDGWEDIQGEVYTINRYEVNHSRGYDCVWFEEDFSDPTDSLDHWLLTPDMEIQKETVLKPGLYLVPTGSDPQDKSLSVPVEFLMSDGFEKSFTGDGQTDPDVPYYQFGDVQVKDISQHLTSLGGQALQYVARSTRLDGNNKGEQVKDLKKAIDLIRWEIERLERQA